MATYLEELQALGWESIAEYEEFQRQEAAIKARQKANPQTLLVANGPWCLISDALDRQHQKANARRFTGEPVTGFGGLTA